MASFEIHVARNRRRTVVLLVGLFTLVAITSFIMGLGAGAQPVPIAAISIVLSVGAVWISWWKSDRIVLAVTKARVIDRESARQLYNIVEEVCIAAGLPVPAIAIVDDPAPNAFATGRDPEHAVIAFTTGLLERMDRDELQGVAAHELAHIANRDTLVMTIAATTAGVIALLVDIGLRVAFYGSGRRRGGAPALLVVGLVAAILAPLAAGLLRAALSRSRETLADATAVSYTRNPAGLRRALERLAADSTVVRARSNATAHMWIESPLERGGVSRWYATHPPIEERIALLQALESDG